MSSGAGMDRFVWWVLLGEEVPGSQREFVLNLGSKLP